MRSGYYFSTEVHKIINQTVLGDCSKIIVLVENELIWEFFWLSTDSLTTEKLFLFCHPPGCRLHCPDRRRNLPLPASHHPAELDLGFSPVDVKPSLGRSIFYTVGLLRHLPMCVGKSTRSSAKSRSSSCSQGVHWIPFVACVMGVLIIF